VVGDTDESSVKGGSVVVYHINRDDTEPVYRAYALPTPPRPPRRLRFSDIGDLEYFGRLAAAAAVGDCQVHAHGSLVFG
jgi:hypothetical protein